MRQFLRRECRGVLPALTALLCSCDIKRAPRTEQGGKRRKQTLIHELNCCGHFQHPINFSFSVSMLTFTLVLSVLMICISVYKAKHLQNRSSSATTIINEAVFRNGTSLLLKPKHTGLNPTLLHFPLYTHLCIYLSK